VLLALSRCICATVEQAKPSFFSRIQLDLEYPTNDTFLPKLSPFRYDDPCAHLLQSSQLALTYLPLLNAFGILLGAVLDLAI
jgi:hypothetical protein